MRDPENHSRAILCSARLTIWDDLDRREVAIHFTSFHIIFTSFPHHFHLIFYIIFTSFLHHFHIIFINELLLKQKFINELLPNQKFINELLLKQKFINELLLKQKFIPSRIGINYTGCRFRKRKGEEENKRKL